MVKCLADAIMLGAPRPATLDFDISDAALLDKMKRADAFDFAPLRGDAIPYTFGIEESAGRDTRCDAAALYADAMRASLRCTYYTIFQPYIDAAYNHTAVLYSHGPNDDISLFTCQALTIDR